MLNSNDVDIPFESKAGLIQTLMRDTTGDPIVLDEWQILYANDTARFIHVDKSRQVGFSLDDSLKGLAKALLEPNYNKMFISTNLQESRNKIQYARQALDSMPAKYQLKTFTNAKTELSLIDKRGRISTLKALTSKEPRGYHGDVTLDEFGFYLNPRKIYKAAIGLITRSGQLACGSSPDRQDSLNWEISTNYENLYSKFRRYKIPWWAARGLCVDVKSALRLAPRMQTEERVRAFGTATIKDIFDSMIKEAFQQEYEIAFVDEHSAFIPYHLLLENEVANFLPGVTDTKDEETDGDDRVGLKCWILRKKNEEKIPSDFWHWVRNNIKGVCEIGVDIGRKRDCTEIVVVDTVGERVEVRAIVELEKVATPVQEEIFRDALRVVQPSIMRIDQTGMGLPIVERLQVTSASVLGVDFTLQSKKRMATRVRHLLERKAVLLPAWHVLREHFHSIDRIYSAAGNAIYESDSNEHHGDLFWAFGLAVDRAERDAIKTVAVFEGRREFADEYEEDDDGETKSSYLLD